MTKILSSWTIANSTCLGHNLGWNVQGFYSPDKFKTAGAFKVFFWTYLFLSRIDLNHTNMKNFSRPGYMKACIHTYNMAENLALQRNSEWGNPHTALSSVILVSMQNEWLWVETK